MDDAVNRVVVNLDKPRTFRLDLQVLSDLQQYLNVGMEKLGEFFVSINGTKGLESLKILLWIVFRQEDPELKLEQVGRMVGIQEMFLLMPLITKHISYAQGSFEGEGKNEKGATTGKQGGIGESPSTLPVE